MQHENRDVDLTVPLHKESDVAVRQSQKGGRPGYRVGREKQNRGELHPLPLVGKRVRVRDLVALQHLSEVFDIE